jgi:hypothetical protein
MESGEDFNPIEQVLVKAKGVVADQGPYQTQNYKSGSREKVKRIK